MQALCRQNRWYFPRRKKQKPNKQMNERYGSGKNKTICLSFKTVIVPEILTGERILWLKEYGGLGYCQGKGNNKLPTAPLLLQRICSAPPPPPSFPILLSTLFLRAFFTTHYRCLYQARRRLLDLKHLCNSKLNSKYCVLAS